MKPIIFSGPMVRAILEGRKTQTRRVIKPQPTGTEPIYNPSHFLPDKGWYFKGGGVSKPRYQPGDILWVRETWCTTMEMEPERGKVHYHYRATPDTTVECCPEGLLKWKPSIFMPKVAARLFLKVTGVRVERLQEISVDDIEAEGAYRVMDIQSDTDDTRLNKGNFADLWDSINGKKYPWASNPWVWVYEFERTEKP